MSRRNLLAQTPLFVGILIYDPSRGSEQSALDSNHAEFIQNHRKLSTIHICLQVPRTIKTRGHAAIPLM